METSTYGRISAAVVPVETAAPGNGPALPLPTPPETPHHISATVVLNRAKALMDSHGCRKQPCDRRHDKRDDCRSEECYAYPATIERESTKLRAMRKGLNLLSWGLMRELDEHNSEGQREYHRKIDEQTALVKEQENYIREVQDQAAESDGT